MYGRYRSWIPFCLALCTFFFACNKKTNDRGHFYSYPINSYYVGTHPTVGVSASVYIVDKENAIQFQVQLKGGIDTNVYEVAIHSYDTNSTYGYATNPYIDLGTIQNNIPIFLESSTTNYSDFREKFKGYIVIHDPQNVSKDITSQIIFGKIGKMW